MLNLEMQAKILAILKLDIDLLRTHIQSPNHTMSVRNHARHVVQVICAKIGELVNTVGVKSDDTLMIACRCTNENVARSLSKRGADIYIYSK